jgi:hypothetical protein
VLLDLGRHRCNSELARARAQPVSDIAPFGQPRVPVGRLRLRSTQAYRAPDVMYEAVREESPRAGSHDDRPSVVDRCVVTLVENGPPVVWSE